MIAWPYGTVVRPIGESLNNYDPEMRQMIVGPQPANPEIIIAIHLNSKSMWTGGMVYAHMAEDIQKRWEEVPD